MASTATAMRGANFIEYQLLALPLPGIRTFDSLAFLAPGVTEAPQSLGESVGPGIGAGIGTSGQFSVNGMRSRSNNFTIDGSDNNDQDVGVRRQGFLSLLHQPIESVKEFQISTLLWDAELGRNVGAQVNAVSRSGSNAFHGQVYGFLTDSKLQARNFFDYEGGPSGGKDPFTRTQAGVAVRGPIVRNRTHFFGNFEYLAINTAREQHFSSPTLEERRFLGLPSFTVLTPSLASKSGIRAVTEDYNYRTNGGATPLGANLLSFYPVPNNPYGPYGPNTLTQMLPASGRGEIFVFKVTHQMTPKHAFHARYNFTDDDREIPSVKRAINSAIDSDVRTQNLSLIFDSALSQTLLNQARFSFGRTRLGFTESRSTRLLFENEVLVPFTRIDKTTNAEDTLQARSNTGPIGELIVQPFSPVGLDAITFPQRRTNNTFQFADTVSKIRRGHSFKFGGDIRLVYFDSLQDRLYRPLVQINNGILETDGTPRYLPGIQFANLGQVSSILQTLTSGPPDSSINLRIAEFDFFFNHNWRVRPRFGVDYGVRYEYNTVPRETNNRIENAISLQNIPPPASRFDDPHFTTAFNNAVAAYESILDGRDRIYAPDKNNFGPHVGFAYDLFGDGRTVIRGGYGVYYDAILGAVVSQSRNVFPTEIPVNLDGAFYPHNGLTLNNPSYFAYQKPQGDSTRYLKENGFNQLAGTQDDFQFLVGSLFLFQPAGGLAFTLPEKKLLTPYVQQWHLTWEYEIKDGYLLSAAYVGTKGARLTRLTTPNGGSALTSRQILTMHRGVPAIDFSNQDANQFGINRPNRSLGAYQIFENSANSNYHAFQLEGRKRYSRSLTLTTAYTLSHAIDEVSDIIETAGAPAIAQNSFDLRVERAHAGFDARHRFAASLIADLYRGSDSGIGRWFGGWQVASIFQAGTGQPFTLNVPIDANLDGNLTDRPSTTQGLIFFDAHGPQRVSLAPSASVGDFYVLGRDGLVGRNTVRGDSLISWDVALNKRFRFTDDQALEFRTEFFNVLNRANFALPIRTMGNPGFGSSVNTITPARIIQFALKYQF
jgi:hypothetical protein